MNLPENWSGVAFNQVPDSDNRIHSDELARAYGFTGALVPGVTVSSYLIHPGVQAWGMDWLNRGAAHATVKSPLYDGSPFTVSVSELTASSCHAELHTQERLSAIATVTLPDTVPTPPVCRGDSLMEAQYEAPQATREIMANLEQQGCPAKYFHWSADHEMALYLRKQQQMCALLRTDGQEGSGGYANIAFLLGCANRHFAAMAQMSPWIHLETRSQNFMAVPLDTRLISEMTVVDLFNRKGHEFADCRFDLYRADDLRCVCTIEQRAIYLMRQP